MSIQCITPLVTEFTVGIPLDCAMNFQTNKDKIKDIGIAVNTSGLVVNLNLVKETLDPPIVIPVECADGGSLTVSTVTVNEVHVQGKIDFMASINVLLPDGNVIMSQNLPLPWPSKSGTICINDSLMAYSDSLNAQYTVKVTTSEVKLEDIYIAVESNLYIFLVTGKLLVEAIPVV